LWGLMLVRGFALVVGIGDYGELVVVVGDWGAGGNGSLMVVEKQRETAEKGEEPGTDQNRSDELKRVPDIHRHPF